MKNKNHVMVFIVAVMVTVWSGSQMVKASWAVEPAAPLMRK